MILRVGFIITTLASLLVLSAGVVLLAVTADSRGHPLDGHRAAQFRSESLMRHPWWAAPFHMVFITPGARRVFDVAYRAFAAGRHRPSTACGLRPVPLERVVSP